jgi:hypothetical protein
MHFSNLSDFSEIVLLTKPLNEALAMHSEPLIMKRQRESTSVRRHGAKRRPRSCCAWAGSYVEAGFVLAFTGGKVSPLDHSYEQENGLLSQWRGYGMVEMVVTLSFLTRVGLMTFLHWNDELPFGLRLILRRLSISRAPKRWRKNFRSWYRNKESSDIDIFTPFSQAATLLKLRGFREEREVRIVACPQSVRALADRGMRNGLAADKKSAWTKQFQEVRRAV